MTPFQTFFLLFELVIAGAMCWTVASMAMSMWHGAPFVPTKKGLILDMLKPLNLRPGMKFLELGCGDGRVVCTAVKHYGVHGRGIEKVWLWALLAQLRTRLMRVSDRVEIFHKNILQADFSWPDVIYLYMMPRFLEKHGDRLFGNLKPGVQVLSHTFEIPALQAHKVSEVKVANITLHLYLL